MEAGSAHMAAVTFAILLMVPTWPTAAQKPDCRSQPTHTLCRSRNKACQHLSRGVDTAARAEILKLHNDYRSQVARGQLAGFKPAADMQELLWHEELAEVAQAHTELCTDISGSGQLQHDQSSDRTTATFPSVGQNLANSLATYVSPTDWGDAVKRWFDEYQYYPSNQIAAFNPSGTKPTGHFTQVIWAKTRYVGCGFLQYHVPDSQWKDVKLYTCNYGPGGNFLGQPVYQVGATCSACPASTVCNQRTGLCGGASGDDASSLPWLPLMVGVLAGLAVGAAGSLFFLRRNAASAEVAAPGQAAAHTATSQSQWTLL